jgi:hypothetical protein
MTEEKLVVSWGIVVTAKDYNEAEKKARDRLVQIIGKDAADKLDAEIDELCISDFCECEDEEE